MREDVATDLKKSSQTFLSSVWPAIGDAWFGGGQIIPVEAVTQEAFATHLDVLAGVDAWLIRNGLGVTAIASRVQFVDGNAYDTFTIRAWRKSGNDTELQKRLRAINEPHRGYLYPHVTVQAYVQKASNDLVSVAAILTKDLFAHVDTYRNKPNTDGKSGFKIARWRNLEALGAKIRIIRNVAKAA